MATATAHAGRRIVLHRADDPARDRIAAWLRTHPGESIQAAAAGLGMDANAAHKAFGLTVETTEPSPDRYGPGAFAFSMRLVPDGERACWDDECPHGAAESLS